MTDSSGRDCADSAFAQLLEPCSPNARDLAVRAAVDQRLRRPAENAAAPPLDVE
jgi:hypothetical protein